MTNNVRFTENHTSIDFHNVKSLTLKSPEEVGEPPFTIFYLVVEFNNGTSQEMGLFMDSGIKPTVTLGNGWSCEIGYKEEKVNEEIPF